MEKLITFFLFTFIGMSILGAILAGGGGMTVTELTSSINSSNTTIPVVDTDNFLDQDYVIINEEKILYTGKTATTFTGATRGYEGTTAESHDDGSNVYTADSSTVNNALGFSIAATTDSMGMWAVVTIPWNFVSKTIPRMVSANWQFMRGDLAIIGFVWYALGAGLIISLAIMLAGGRRV